MRSCSLSVGAALLAVLAGCGGSASRQACGQNGNLVSSRAGSYDFVLGLSAPTSSPAPVHLDGMAGTSAAHLDVWVCPVGKKHAVVTVPRATVLDRSSGKRAPLPLGRHGHHSAANLNLPHHASVELAYGDKRVSLIPPTD